ncbi:MAG: hypothetical protein KDB35_00095 [Acidimicrobiales bacterium]|nr:hypothetical protein [Acidimicrobiales bacterium]MCB1248500.1 hypothetical protein [Acidimicrobiales bacterium]MCB1262116.1 hypothetical protein [Acidimicrobiales bacterium]
MFREFSTKQKIALAIPLVVAVVAFTILWFSDLSSSPTADDRIIEALIPEPSAKVPQQSEVGVDLQGGWGATLIVDGIVIPEDQLIISEGQARITFRPGPGQAVETFQAGQNCASVVYFPLTSPDQQFTRNWCFSVV